MKIIDIVVDEIPKNCGDCVLMQYLNGGEEPHCCGISDENKSIIEGNPYLMKYRRSDCPLKGVQNDSNR